MKLRLFPTEPFSASSKLVVGVSGGLDSVALLSLLLEQRSQSRPGLVVAHVNYGLRGKHSISDEKLVKELSLGWGLPCRVLRVKAPKKSGQSLQEWAREIRYRFFASVVQRESAWGVAVAHHLEDQAETILDRLLRGAGPRGLSGLRSVQELSLLPRPRPSLKIWRPLLFYSKEELREYLLGKKIPWREDASNKKLLYRRNQIRHQIIPFLSKWNSGLTRKLAQTGEILESEDAWLENWVESLSRQLGEKKTGPRYALSLEKFQKLSLPIQRRVIRRGAEILEPLARGLSFDRLEEALEVWRLKRKGPRDLGFGLSVGVKDQELFIRKSGILSQ